MLKTLSVLRTPELLHVLASMGHGDEIALVDCNFPDASMAQRLVRVSPSFPRLHRPIDIGKAIDGQLREDETCAHRQNDRDGG